MSRQLDTVVLPVPSGQTKVFQHHSEVTARLGVGDVTWMKLKARLAKASLLRSIGQFHDVVGEWKPSRVELVLQALQNVCEF